MKKGNSRYKINKKSREKKRENNALQAKKKPKLTRLPGDFTKLRVTTKDNAEEKWAFSPSLSGESASVGVCYYSKHPGLLTAFDVNEQGCIEKGCKMLKKTNMEFWNAVEQTKRQEIAEKKQALANADSENISEGTDLMSLLEKITFDKENENEDELEGARITITKENRTQLSDAALDTIISRASRSIVDPADLDAANLAIREKSRRESERNRMKKEQEQKELKIKEYAKDILASEEKYLYPDRSIKTINKKSKKTNYKTKKGKFYRDGQIKDRTYMKMKTDKKRQMERRKEQEMDSVLDRYEYED